MSHLSRRSLLTGAVAASAGLLLAACGSSSGSSGSSSGGNAGAVTQLNGQGSSSAYQGVSLGRSFDKPSATLTDTSGKPFDIAKQTAGKAVLLYFGYTHCPDVCPTTIGDIAVAISKLPKAQQKSVEVVFVTTDPARDTPATLRSWLNSFNSGFIGLTGDINTIIAAAKSVGVAVEAPAKGQEPVHGAQVLAYAPTDDKAHILYTSGTTSATYLHDLPLLIKGVTA
ncbi:SCO family protein [Streptacidiphilus carbonis]|uniref:SCO family protein n=1 Tax=Streptacidiphilus carbonis TaxID=105422 RepID=UPI0005A754B6|nr:SCO family protein [Streptacidiphilus carbonis]